MPVTPLRVALIWHVPGLWVFALPLAPTVATWLSDVFQVAEM